jgi:hypothetical protein
MTQENCDVADEIGFVMWGNTTYLDPEPMEGYCSIPFMMMMTMTMSMG